MHYLLLYEFNLCYNLMKKPLLERAMAYKNLDIKFSKSPKNIKESDGPLLGIIEKKKNIYIYIYMTKQ